MAEAEEMLDLFNRLRLNDRTRNQPVQTRIRSKRNPLDRPYKNAFRINQLCQQTLNPSRIEGVFRLACRYRNVQ